MTNREKIFEDFGINLESSCICTSDEVAEECIYNGDCFACEKWLNAEFKEKLESMPHETVTECGARYGKELKSKMSLDEYTVELNMTIKEDCDRFIFDAIGPWLSLKYQVIIPKKVLLRSIECFKQEHKEEFDALMEAYGKEE